MLTDCSDPAGILWVGYTGHKGLKTRFLTFLEITSSQLLRVWDFVIGVVIWASRGTWVGIWLYMVSAKVSVALTENWEEIDGVAGFKRTLDSEMEHGPGRSAAPESANSS